MNIDFYRFNELLAEIIQGSAEHSHEKGDYKYYNLSNSNNIYVRIKRQNSSYNLPSEIEEISLLEGKIESVITFVEV